MHATQHFHGSFLLLSAAPCSSSSKRRCSLAAATPLIVALAAPAAPTAASIDGQPMPLAGRGEGGGNGGQCEGGQKRRYQSNAR